MKSKFKECWFKYTCIQNYVSQESLTLIQGKPNTIPMCTANRHAMGHFYTHYGVLCKAKLNHFEVLVIKALIKLSGPFEPINKDFQFHSINKGLYMTKQNL